MKPKVTLNLSAAFFVEDHILEYIGQKTGACGDCCVLMSCSKTKSKLRNAVLFHQKMIILVSIA